MMLAARATNGPALASHTISEHPAGRAPGSED
jgi:hypothetical protein